MKKIFVISLFVTIFSILVIKVSFPQQPSICVSVIAPSVSTSMMAREIRIKNGWCEVTPQKANFILVVVRSSLYNPLNYSYASYDELNKDAERQMNIAGPNYHIYLYSISDDSSVKQEEHKSFEAND